MDIWTSSVCGGHPAHDYFDVLTNDSPVGWKGERTRLFLSDTGYEKALDSQEKGQIKILSHAKVRQGNLHYDRSDQLR